MFSEIASSPEGLLAMTVSDACTDGVTLRCLTAMSLHYFALPQILQR